MLQFNLDFRFLNSNECHNITFVLFFQGFLHDEYVPYLIGMFYLYIQVISNYLCLCLCFIFKRLKILINKTNCKEVEHSKSTMILINVTCKMMNISSWQIRLFVLRILSFNHLFVFVGCWKILWTESLFLRSMLCLIYFTLFYFFTNRTIVSS